MVACIRIDILVEFSQHQDPIRSILFLTEGLGAFNNEPKTVYRVFTNERYTYTVKINRIWIARKPDFH